MVPGLIFACYAARTTRVCDSQQYLRSSSLPVLLLESFGAVSFNCRDGRNDRLCLYGVVHRSASSQRARTGSTDTSSYQARDVWELHRDVPWSSEGGLDRSSEHMPNVGKRVASTPADKFDILQAILNIV